MQSRYPPGTRDWRISPPGAKPARLLLAALFAVGCGGAENASRDAGASDADPDDSGEGGWGYDPVPPEPPADPTPPEQPRLPLVTPCPERWREVPDPDVPDVVACDPWPPGGPAACEADAAHFPGRAECERIGTGCPDGDFAEDLPDDVAIVRVLAGAPEGGDGSPGAPFGTIAEALADAEDGAVVAISKGSFDEAIVVDRPVTLWGACVAETRIASSVESVSTPTIDVAGPADVAIRNLTVSGSRPGIRVRGASVTIEAILVDGARGRGLDLVVGGSLEATDLVVRDTAAIPDVADSGQGLLALDGSTAGIVRGVFEGNALSGVDLRMPGTELVAEDLAIGGTVPVDGGDGHGMRVVNRARADLARAVVEGNRTFGIWGRHRDTQIVASDLVVRSTRARESDGADGRGLWLEAGARADLTRALLDGNQTSGVRVSGAGSELVGRDLLVRDTRATGLEESGNGGTGIEAESEGRIDLERAAILRNRSAGIAVRESGEAVAADLLVVGTREEAASRAGGAAVFVAKGRAEVIRARLERNRKAGFLVGEGGILEARDVVVRETREQEIDDKKGNGLLVYSGGSATVMRAVFASNLYAAAYVMEPGSLFVGTDIVLSDTEPQPHFDSFGAGLIVMNGARAEIERAHVDRNRYAGLYVDPGGPERPETRIVARDVKIRDTRFAFLGDLPILGVGAIADNGAALDLVRALVERSRGSGIFLAGSGTTLTGTDLTVRETEARGGGRAGYGLDVEVGATVDLERAVFETNRGAGIATYDPRTRATFRELVVEPTLEMECAADGCDAPGGIGIVAADGASVEATGFRVSASALAGVQLARGGTMDLHLGDVSGNPIGASVQTDGFEVRRLADRVRFRNDRNLDSASLPVPEPYAGF